MKAVPSSPSHSFGVGSEPRDYHGRSNTHSGNRNARACNRICNSKRAARSCGARGPPAPGTAHHITSRGPALAEPQRCCCCCEPATAAAMAPVRGQKKKERRPRPCPSEVIARPCTQGTMPRAPSYTVHQTGRSHTRSSKSLRSAGLQPYSFSCRTR